MTIDDIIIFFSEIHYTTFCILGQLETFRLCSVYQFQCVCVCVCVCARARALVHERITN